MIPTRLNRFKTRERANHGVRLPLIDPATGKDSGDWIHILGVDSDACREMKTEGQRDLLRAGNSDMGDEEVAALVEDWKLKQLAVLITDWSFAHAPEDDPDAETWECNEENVMELLREAPHIADAVDRAATRRALFFKEPPAESDSGDTPEPSSSSTSAQPDPE